MRRLYGRWIWRLGQNASLAAAVADNWRIGRYLVAYFAEEHE